MEDKGRKRRNVKKTNNSVRLITIGLLIIVITLVTYFVFNQFRNDTSVSVDIHARDMLDKAKLKETNFTFNVEEERFIEILHRMTHQKVKSKYKHSSVELSEDNVEAMLHILSQNKYDRGDVYKEILNKWKHENFKDIVEDHNRLRSLSKDKDGFAYSKMSKLQEREFVKDNFK